MRVAIVMPTHNRLEYTKKALTTLLERKDEEFELYIWDNDSKDGTKEYLKELNDPRIVEKKFSETNMGATAAMNHAWSKTDADLVGKVDNDCLVTPGWTEIFRKAHVEVPDLGAIALWHYPKEDFNEEEARKRGKIQRFGTFSVLRHPWVCGSGFLIKRNDYIAIGPFEYGWKSATTDFFMKLAMKGKVNGWMYPPILQDHMDNPSSKHSLLKSDCDIIKYSKVTYSHRVHGMKTLKDRLSVQKRAISPIFYEPWDVKYYFGWRSKVRTFMRRFRMINKRLM